MVLEGEAQEVSESESILAVCVYGEPVVDHSGRCVLDDGVWEGVVKSGPVCECVGLSVRKHEVLPVYCGGDV